MPAPWTKAVIWSSILLAAASGSASAEPAASVAGQGDAQSNALCAKDQLAGQYECVQSTLLSDEEVRINMAYLASFGSRHTSTRGDDSWRLAAGGAGTPARNTSELYFTQACGPNYLCDQDGAGTRSR